MARHPNKRIVKKKVDRMVAAGLSLTMALSHARPSFWDLRDVGQQRKYLRATLSARFGSHGLGVHPRRARYVTHRWMPADWPMVWRQRAVAASSLSEGKDNG